MGTEGGESCCWCSCRAPALLHTLPRLWRGKAAARTRGDEIPSPAASLQPFPALPLAPGEPRAASLALHTAPGSASPSRVPHRDNPFLLFRVALPNLSFSPPVLLSRSTREGGFSLSTEAVSFLCSCFPKSVIQTTSIVYIFCLNCPQG